MRFGAPRVLGCGRVCNVNVEHSYPTVVSHVLRLCLTYEPDESAAPRSVIFKTGLPGRTSDLHTAGRQEVAFYGQIAPLMSARLVPRCFDAAWHEDTKAWHLVLEDLSESHTAPTAWPLPPTMAQCEAILGALARFNGAWWDDPRLGISVGTWIDPATYAQRLQGFAAHFIAFADRVGDRLSGERRDLYRRVLDAAPRLFARYHSHRNVTLIHGDAHVWNVLMPRRALDDDYRLSVLLQILTPVLQAAYDIPPWIWWNNLERILLAVDDLGCRELLG